MSIISPADLEASPLADLHALASALGIDGYRRLRKPDLVDAILARQGATPAPRSRSRRAAAPPVEETAQEPAVETQEPAAEAEEPAGEADGRPARAGRSRRRRGRGRDGEGAPETGAPERAEEEPAERERIAE